MSSEKINVVDVEIIRRKLKYIVRGENVAISFNLKKADAILYTKKVEGDKVEYTVYLFYPTWRAKIVLDEKLDLKYYNIKMNTFRVEEEKNENER
jgi:hypothetical protein